MGFITQCNVDIVYSILRSGRKNKRKMDCHSLNHTRFNSFVAFASDSADWGEWGMVQERETRRQEAGFLVGGIREKLRKSLPYCVTIL